MFRIVVVRDAAFRRFALTDNRVLRRLDRLESAVFPSLGRARAVARRHMPAGLNWQAVCARQVVTVG